MTRSQRRITVTLAALTPLLANCPARGLAQGTALDVKATGKKTFYVDGRAGNNQVSILSQSTLEDFTVVCNKVTGQCDLDPKSVESLRGKFSVRVEDLRTGIDLRDEHLRTADWLDAAKSPEIIIEVTGIEDAKKTGANQASLVLVGTCTVRGKTNPIKIPTDLVYLDESPTTMKRVKGDLLRLRSEFKLKLSDYGITGPPGSDVIGLKVADTLDVRVTVFGSTEKAPENLAPDKEAPASSPVKPPPPKRPG
jgi:polyisoprenoid-binding protein YceI